MTGDKRVELDGRVVDGAFYLEPVAEAALDEPGGEVMPSRTNSALEGDDAPSSDRPSGISTFLPRKRAVGLDVLPARGNFNPVACPRFSPRESGGFGNDLPRDVLHSGDVHIELGGDDVGFALPLRLEKRRRPRARR